MLEREIGSGWCSAFYDALDALYEDSSRVLMMPYPFIQLFIKWHFDLITEDCEKVYVTEEFNPYK